MDLFSSIALGDKIFRIFWRSDMGTKISLLFRYTRIYDFIFIIATKVQVNSKAMYIPRMPSSNCYSK